MQTMQMKKLLLGSVLAMSSVLTVTACSSVNASTEATPTTSKMQHKGMKDGLRGPMAQLDLTATQQAQIKAVMQEKSGDRKNERAKHQAEHAQMQQQIQALVNANTLDNATLNRLADQQAAKTKQRFIEHVQTQHAISRVLTAEQRAKMAQLKSERTTKGHHGSKNHKMHDQAQ